MMVVMVIGSFTYQGYSQSHEAQQLLLNWEKLAQLKSILNNMYKGYQVVSAGYNRIRDLSQGNFQLHQLFLDGLLDVSPAVRKYKRVADIIRQQQRILQEGKKALTYFTSTGSFTRKEIDYMRNVYGHLLEQSIQNLDELFVVVTAGKLRMSDDERLAAIDRIFKDMEDKLLFLRSFGNSNKILSHQRIREKESIELSRKLHGIH